MHDDFRDEPTSPGTPEALATLREVHARTATILARLDAICDSLDALERTIREARTEARAAKVEASHAFRQAREAAQVSRFTDKRVDSLVSRIQAVENAGR